MSRQAQQKSVDTPTQERPKRVPLAGRNRLEIRQKDPAYVYRYVNANLENDPDRVERMKEAGYEIVPRAEAGQLGDNRVDNSSPLGSAASINVGQGTRAVLMRQRREWFDQDQAAKQAELDATEQTMRRESKSDYGTLDLINPKSR